MDLRFSEEYEAYRSEVKAFLADNWPLEGEEAKLTLTEQQARFRARAIGAGYLARAILRKYGGSEQLADVLKGLIIRQEFGKAQAPLDPAGNGPTMLVPTLLEHGTEEQKERIIPPTMKGELVFCQGYSEPGSGSDLASVQTRAELVGDEWVINGQKTWTSGAQTADYCFCLCRTEPEQSKHAGISYLLIPMKQPGVDVRPLKQMSGDSHFNEVFFDDARTTTDNLVGKRGEGWIVSRSTLKHERNTVGNAQGVAMLFERLVMLAKHVDLEGRPAIQDATVRERLAEIEGYVRSHEYSGYRQLTCDARRQDPGPVVTMNKLVGTNIGKMMGKLGLDLVGDGGLSAPASRWGGDPLVSGSWVSQFMGSHAQAIAGGTSNIQRNIIGERALGLPRDWAAQSSK